MYVVGTAGHVDHGKSTLVLALTGINPDRLREEQEREMTIDLGYAWLRLADGNEISIIDVPGHERFIKNMLAGVGGIDAAILVVAADEGPMPQTREHLAILNLLQIERAVVALTKCDLVDEDWLALVSADVRSLLAGTRLAAAPIVPVSARTGAGLDALQVALAAVLAGAPSVSDQGRARLPIDRAFSIAGFGTVVTGTLLDGALAVGQEVEVGPGPHGAPLRSRIRGLQMHKQKVELAPPGNRVAVNLIGLEVGELRRGQVLTLPGRLETSDRLDVSISTLADAPMIAQNNELDLFVGTSETAVRLTILDQESLAAGAQGWAQLRLANPVVVARGDRFILRQPSPSRTVAGGVIVDPQPRRHKRFQPNVLVSLSTLAKGDPADLLLTVLRQPLELKQAGSLVQLGAAAAEQAAAQLLGEGRARKLAGYLIGSGAWADLSHRLREVVALFHQQHPLRAGIGKEELRGKLGLDSKPFAAVLAAAAEAKIIVPSALEQAGRLGGSYHLPDFVITLSPAQQQQADRYLTALQANPYAPPSPAELGLEGEGDVLTALLERGEVVKAGGVFFARAAHEAASSRVLALIDAGEKVSVASLRDLYGASRKYALAILESLDEAHFTRREGDWRVRY